MGKADTLGKLLTGREKADKTRKTANRGKKLTDRKGLTNRERLTGRKRLTDRQKG